MHHGIFEFGSFRLDTRLREILFNDKPVRLGGRAYDVLVALLISHGQVLSKTDLMAAAWGNTHVSEGALRYQINDIRKMLALDEGGAAKLTTISGRGYSFSGTVHFIGDDDGEVVPQRDSHGDDTTTLAPVLFGRDDAMNTITGMLEPGRLLTIVAPGGFGKTALAKAVARSLGGRAVTMWVDLTNVKSTKELWRDINIALGLTGPVYPSTMVTKGMMQGRFRILLFDCCDMCIDVVAKFVKEDLPDLPGIAVMATSREPIAVDDERIFQLGSLSFPSGDTVLSEEDAGSYSAIKMFIDRASRLYPPRGITNGNLKDVAAICARLDGIPLALEIAASQLGVLGVEDLARLLARNVDLANTQPSIGPERHLTVGRTIDWSLDRLSEREIETLESLSVLSGPFSAEAYLSFVSNERFSENEALSVLTMLIRKSLVSRSDEGGRAVFRLLDTMRAHCQLRAKRRGTWEALQDRLAAYLVKELRAVSALYVGKDQIDTWFSAVRPNLVNLREALEWHLSREAPGELGLQLALEAAPLYMQFSFLTECAELAHRALSTFPNADPMLRALLSAFLGGAINITQGPTDESKAAFEYSASVAEERGDAKLQTILYTGLYWLWMMREQPRKAMECGEALRGVLGAGQAAIIADNYRAMALQMLGNQREAETALLKASSRTGWLQPGRFMTVGTKPSVMLRVCLVKSLWLQGRFNAAISEYREIEETLDEPIHLNFRWLALNHVMIQLYCAMEDFSGVAAMVAKLRACIEGQPVPIRRLSADAAISAAALLEGRERLAQTSRLIDLLDQRNYHYSRAWLGSVEVEALLRAGSFSKAAETATANIARSRSVGSEWWLAELLSQRGMARAALGSSDAMEDFLDSRATAERQGASALAVRNLARVTRAPIDTAAKTIMIEESKSFLDSYPRDGDPMLQRLAESVYH